MDRLYRIFYSKDLFGFRIKEKESDIFILSKKNLKSRAEKILKKIRNKIENYIKRNDIFKDSFLPVKENENMPEIVKKLASVSNKTGIGPMAGIAGLISEELGMRLLEFTDEIIIENGGDIFLKILKPRIIGIYTEKEKFKKLGIKIKPEMTPCGICSSSSKMGHSLSFGNADLVTVIAEDTTLADSLATIIANKINDVDDIEKTLKELEKFDIRGAFVIKDNNIGVYGEIDFVEIER